MPFPYNCSLIAGLLQQLRECLLAAVKTFRIVGKAILMAMLARQQTGTTGTAQRVGDETVRKPYAFISNPVDIRSFDKTMIVSTNCLIRMIIAHDIENIHRLLRHPFFVLLDTGRKSYGYQTCQKK